MKKFSLIIVFCLIIFLAITNVAVAKNLLGGETFTLKVNQFKNLYGSNSLSKIYFNIDIGYAGINSQTAFSQTTLSLIFCGDAEHHNLFFNSSHEIEIVYKNKIVVILKIVEYSYKEITLQFKDAIKLE